MRKFKTESQKLLDLMINSIYTNREIFLRELISNASDAVDKLYFRSLTDSEVQLTKDDLEIMIAFDKDARTITVSDCGIGIRFQTVGGYDSGSVPRFKESSITRFNNNSRCVIFSDVATKLESNDRGNGWMSNNVNFFQWDSAAYFPMTARHANKCNVAFMDGHADGRQPYELASSTTDYTNFNPTIANAADGQLYMRK